MNKKIRGLAACGLAAALPALAQKECTKADAAAADKALDRVVTYANLNKAWKDFRHCDSGSVDEGFTDAILRLVVQWKDIEVLAQDVQMDAGYKQFIFKHLASPAAKEDRPSIYSRAKANCPMTQGAFCEEVAQWVREPKSPAPVPSPPPAAAATPPLAPAPELAAPPKLAPAPSTK